MPGEIEVLYQDFKDALTNLLVGNTDGFANRATLWKARAPAEAHPQFDPIMFASVVLQAHEQATASWLSRRSPP
jgi:hypothetical protein